MHVALPPGLTSASPFCCFWHAGYVATPMLAKSIGQESATKEGEPQQQIVFF
jgi:hypothetical protein